MFDFTFKYKQKAEIILRKTFKEFTGIKKKVSNETISLLMGYNLQERSKRLMQVAEERWTTRVNHQNIKPPSQQSQQQNEKLTSLSKNKCKFQGVALIKLINLQTVVCQQCRNLSHNAMCSISHLNSVHGCRIESIDSVIEMVQAKAAVEAKKKPSDRMTRQEMIEFADRVAEPEIRKIQSFLGTTSFLTPPTSHTRTRIHKTIST